MSECHWFGLSEDARCDDAAADGVERRGRESPASRLQHLCLSLLPTSRVLARWHSQLLRLQAAGDWPTLSIFALLMRKRNLRLLLLLSLLLQKLRTEILI